MQDPRKGKTEPLDFYKAVLINISLKLAISIANIILGISYVSDSE